ncbi:protein of unknown function [Blastococcus saxobsidens DD2]|uniref:Uncharacterized protein n=1 Tax=Blastococcus saxobsidens (strain DD2) TaxID=1146883 RepID=H6RP76_BLASD|nr:protein of unknown function [Blastococcus saxobsidens DD2]
MRSSSVAVTENRPNAAAALAPRAPEEALALAGKADLLPGVAG